MEEAAAIQLCLISSSLNKANEPADLVTMATKLMVKLLALQEKELASILRDSENMVCISKKKLLKYK